jgi:hypothetical protein
MHMIAYKGFRTVGSLLLTNADFRLFVTDLSTIGRQILADSAYTLSGAAENIGHELELSEHERKTIQGAGADEAGQPPSKDQITDAPRTCPRQSAMGL